MRPPSLRLMPVQHDRCFAHLCHLVGTVPLASNICSSYAQTNGSIIPSFVPGEKRCKSAAATWKAYSISECRTPAKAKLHHGSRSDQKQGLLLKSIATCSKRVVKLLCITIHQPLCSISCIPSQLQYTESTNQEQPGCNAQKHKHTPATACLR